jgi:outer membrane murein-binding lipoprotein Lpp
MKRLPVLALLLLAIAALHAVPASAGPAQKKQAAKMYKWTDKHGVVHYGSAIPPEYADQQKEQINSQGQTIKTIDGAMTPEQRAAREKEKADAEAAKEQLAHDKVLLSTYGSVNDIERARDSRLNAIQAQINLASSAVSSLEAEIGRLEKQRTSAIEQKKDAKTIERLDGSLAAQRKQLNESQRAVIVRQDEKAAAAKAFEQDIVRYREMTTPKPATPKTKP